MEVLRTGERLPDECRADRLAVPHDELTVSLVAHRQVGDTGDEQGIADAQDKAGD